MSKPRKPDKGHDYLAEMLLTQWPHTHLPEIYNIFGKDGFIKFINIFAGCQLVIPTREEIEKASVNHTVYNKWRSEGIAARELAKMYDWPLDRVNEILTQLEDLYKRLDLS